MVQEQQQKRRKRVRDFCLYVLISMFVLGIVVCAAMGDVHQDLFMRWFGFALLTFFLLGFFIEASRSLWKQRSFRLWTSILFCVHSAVLLLRLTGGASCSGRGFGFTLMAEGALLAALRKWKYPDSAEEAANSR